MIGKTNAVTIIGGGGSSTPAFNFDTLQELTTPTLNDYMIINQNGIMYKIKTSTLSSLFGGIPVNAVKYNGEVVTYNGEIVIN